MNYRWFLRMAKWAHTPPSTSRVVLVLGVVAFCLVIYAVDVFIGWPDWMQLEPTRRGRFQ